MSLLEILVVLAIFAMGTAVIMPSSAKMLDQATAHAVFFEFQREVSDLRREANRTETPIRLIDPQVQPDPALGERRVRLREPWRYTMAPTLEIDEGGACGTTTANLLNGDRVVMTLRTDDGTCRFSRLQTTAAPPREPSSPQ
ncbi:Tfp pilus assembly protein FimT/FimU [Brevundimonas staleyi]